MTRDNGTSQPLLDGDDPGDLSYGRASNGNAFKSVFDSQSPRDRLAAAWAVHRRRFLIVGALVGSVLLLAKISSGRASGTVGSYDRSLAIVGPSDIKGDGSLWAVITTINYPTDTVKVLDLLL